MVDSARGVSRVVGLGASADPACGKADGGSYLHRGRSERATGFRPDVVDDRFVLETRFRGGPWEVVVEPDELEHLLVVVMAYPVEP